MWGDLGGVFHADSNDTHDGWVLSYLDSTMVGIYFGLRFKHSTDATYSLNHFTVAGACPKCGPNMVSRPFGNDDPMRIFLTPSILPTTNLTYALIYNSNSQSIFETHSYTCYKKSDSACRLLWSCNRVFFKAAVNGRGIRAGHCGSFLSARTCSLVKF